MITQRVNFLTVMTYQHSGEKKKRRKEKEKREKHTHAESIIQLQLFIVILGSLGPGKMDKNCF